MAKVEQFPDPSGEKTIEQDIKAQKTKEITKEVRDQIKEAVPEQATDTRVGPGGDRLAGEDAGTGRDRSAEGIPDSDRARMEESREKERFLTTPFLWAAALISGQTPAKAREAMQDAAHAEILKRTRTEKTCS